MSGTKSHSQRAPATDPVPQALIVAHGQPSDPDPAEAALAQLTARVQACLSDFRVTSATMAAPGTLENAIKTLPKNAPIYPLFMADGWFVKTALAKRLDGHDLQVMTPLGLDPRLPAVAAQAVMQAAYLAGWTAAETHILLAAHGSAKGKAAASSARLFADRLSKILPCTGISIGFVEEAPYLANAATLLPAQTLCLPFFAMEGEHVRDDIPEALDKASFTGPTLPPFGKIDDTALLIADALHNRLSAQKAA